MSFAIRFGSALVFLFLLLYVCSLVSKGRLLLKYSLLWIFLCCLALLSLLVPDLVYCISNWLGFITASNFVLVIAIVLLLLISLSLSIAISRLVLAIKNLTQRIALLEKDLENHRRIR